MPGTDDTERIAIVGVGGIFPGAPDLDQFWKNIESGIDSGRHVPPKRWYLSPEKAYAPWPPQPDRVYSTWGCFIEGFSFDPEGLDLDRELLSKLDPMFHLGLHAARAAYQDARLLTGVDRSRVGVILGNIALPTESTSAICRDVLGRTFVEKLIDSAASAAGSSTSDPKAPGAWLCDPEAVKALKASFRRSDWHPLNRFATGLPASLIAKGLGFGGMTFTLDAACASSLYSLKFAAEELLAHRADAMLAGGMSRPDCQYTQMGFAQLQALSRSGRCSPLSSRADGLVVGEGAGVFVLKRLSDAVANGDHIYGVIAGIGLSNDRGANLLAPHSEGQLRAMRSAYDQAGWKPSDVDLIECHATGTPVGDAVEISSLHQLWQHESARPKQCVIGGVKSNVGHLLTGAGAAGLMKVLFAIKHGVLPPTANFAEPAEQLSSSASPFRVLGRAEPWERRASIGPSGTSVVPRRATINAFGFGGINAHVLVEEWIPVRDSVTSQRTPRSVLGDSSESIAIVGLEAHYGPRFENKQQIPEGVFQQPDFKYVDLNWWGVEKTDWFQREGIHDDYGQSSSADSTAMGQGIGEVRLPIGQYRIPPLEMQDMLPQQQLMLKVAAGALRDANLPHQGASDVSASDSLCNRTGVIIGLELDPNTTNFHFRWSIEQDAQRWAQLLGLDLSEEQLADWILQLKADAGPPLTPNRVMGNLGGIVASRLAREFDVGGPSFTVSCGYKSDVVALNLAVRALRRGELDRAIVGGVELAADPRPLSFPNRPATSIDDQGSKHDVRKLRFHTSDIAEAILLKRERDASRDGDRIYGVVHEPAQKRDRRGERKWLDEWLAHNRGNLCVAGFLCIPSLYAYTGVNIWQRSAENPATSDWSRGQLASIFPRRKNSPRSLANLVPDHLHDSALGIEEYQGPTSEFVEAERRRPIGELPFGIFVIDGASIAELGQVLQELECLIADGQTIERIATRWFQRRRPDSRRRLALTLIATSAEDLRRIIAIGRRQMSGMGTPADGASKQVFFSADPLAAKGRMAFVFPGSGNAFARMGRTLLAVFPDVIRRQESENEDLPSQLNSHIYWMHPRLETDHKSMIFAQVAIGSAICDLLALFGVRPSASIGYSLGESSALFGLRAWTDRDEMLERMTQSTLFGSDLVEPFDAARKAWRIPEGEAVNWGAGIVDRSATEIRDAMRQMRQSDPALNRVYLLIVNTPRQCVIGGEKSQVEALVRQLGARFVPLASPSTVHCEVLRQVEEAYRELHLMPTSVPTVETEQGTKPIDFYSASWGRKYDLNRESAAEAIVAQAVDTIDFPKVIEQAYADGVRTFVEIGPGSSCTRMIDEILGDRPHFVRSALPVTKRPVEAFFELLAALIAERVPVDLSYLYDQPIPDETPKTAVREVVTRIGGLPFEIPTPPGGWKFSDSVAPSHEEPPVPVTLPGPTLPGQTAPGPSDGKGMADESNDVPFEPSFDSQADLPQDSVDQPDEELISVATLVAPSDSSFHLWDQFQLMIDHRTKAHETFLRLSGRIETLAAEQLALLTQLPVSDAQTGESVAQYSVLSTQYGVLSTEQSATERSATTSIPRQPAPTPPVLANPPAAPDTVYSVPGTQYSVPNTPHSVPSTQSSAPGSPHSVPSHSPPASTATPTVAPDSIPVEPPRSLTREQCMEFAIGKIGRVLGQKFAAIDQNPTRVRLPDEPLMLVDRILTIEGEPLSMTSGRVVTEHDIHPGAWYLDCGRIPTCIAVESGQADLFLSGWLGIDFQTHGHACYRLLDAVVTFHDALPQPGQTIHYDIKVLHFFRQGDTYLFRFEFDATVNGRPLLTMREGCAGFFTDAELAGGKGIIHTALDKRPRPGIRPADWSDPVPLAVESYSDEQLLALRRGDLAGCFGPAFAGLPLASPVTLPGLAASKENSSETRSRMWLIDRVLTLDPVGGKFGLGTILGELDIHPDDWFLTCHFCDDQVMPGTLMYECCLHTLRIYLLRMGWIGESGQIVYEPIPGVRSRLKCRGQVLASTKKVWYEVTLKEIGYGRGVTSEEGQHPSDSNGAAYCLADALMYADGKPIVEITDMSVRLTGLTKQAVDRLWQSRAPGRGAAVQYDRRPAIFDTDRITAFAIGKPSDAFGDRYLPFDSERKIARLPGPPFQFLDRIVSIQNCQPWVLQAGGEIVAQYDVPVNAWYFASNRQPTMPFAVLLETALQPCGWLAAYLGSALTSDTDLSFRNLGGSAIQHRDVTPLSGTLTTKVKMTRVSNSAGMIIQHYDYELSCAEGPVYVGNTYFGFFSKAALANQIGIRDAAVYAPTVQELSTAARGQYPISAPFPDDMFRMIQNVESLSQTGGPFGNGFVVGTMPVDPTAWFFKAHFYEDPVVPGSLGLESFWQLVKVYAGHRWQLGADAQFETPKVGASSVKHEWIYRGQVIPRDQLVTVTAVIRDVDDAARTVTAEGFLSVDGRVIYQMKQFVLGVTAEI